MSLKLNGTDGVTFNDGSEQWAAASPLGTKNLVINGDMRIAQRGTSALTVNANSVFYPVDRFHAVGVASAGVFTAQQVSDSPDGGDKSLKFTVTTASASSGAYRFHYNLEGNHVAHLGFGQSWAKTFTLSFWVKSSVTGTYSGSLRNSAHDRSYVFEYTIDTANTWERKTITITGDTTGTWLTDNNSGLKIIWSLSASATGTAGLWQSGNYFASTNQTEWIATSGATFYISQIQLEVGDTATPFEHRPFDMELERCKRYYQKSYEYATAPGTATDKGRLNMGGNNAGATASFLMGPHIRFSPEMRSAPTMYGYDGGGAINKISRIQLSLADSGNNAISIVNQSTQGCTTYSGSGASRSGAGCHFTADAEL